MSRKLRQPPIKSAPWPSRAKVARKAETWPIASPVRFGEPLPASVADHFRGDPAYLERFKSMRPDQRLSEYQDARRYTETGELAERQLKRDRLAILEGADNELRVRGK